ncbi:MAG: N-acetylglucosamine-6-phosphate deacetylase [Pseudomonadota bacterium]
MTASEIFVSGGPIFDGHTVHQGAAARFVDGRFDRLVAVGDLPAGATVTDLDGDILAPGCVDLQVNGGGGLLLNDAPSVDTLSTICAAHRGLGTTRLLPTLISDRVEITQAAIAAVTAALGEGVPGVVGLHLEGPHLSLARKGAHDGAVIRPMTARDLEMLLSAKAAIPVLKVTIAPENVTLAQVAQLSQAGILVSLGHTDADYDTCMAYAAAGATCATHLFNAMSQMGNRAPGLVGAVLANAALSAGLIADGVHVHPATMRAAWAAKTGPGRIFLVSDAMAVAGTDLSEFTLNDRIIRREDGQLRLLDGTLAGADLDLIRAMGVLVSQVGVPLVDALSAATVVPARLCGLTRHHLRGPGLPLDQVIRMSRDFGGAQVLADLVALQAA